MTKIIKMKQVRFKTLLLVLVSIVLFTLSACDDGKLDYDDFEADHLPSWSVTEDQEEDQYLVYYYGITCSHCAKIKDQVLAFAAENSAELKMYFIESGSLSEGDYEMYPVVDPQTLEPVPGSPTMLLVKNGKVVSMNVGPVIISDLLTKIEEGSYALID